MQQKILIGKKHSNRRTPVLVSQFPIKFFFEFLYCIICNAVGPEEVSVENDPKSSD